MKSRIILAITLLVLSVLIFSCVTSHDYYTEISCEQFQENPKGLEKDYQIETGDKIYVVLCSNPTTGFEWTYEMSGDTVLKVEDHDFEAPKGDVPGAAGRETWVFEASEKGSTVINMKYSQPWEGGMKGEWTYKIDVVVE